MLCRHLGLDPKWLMEFLTDTSGAPNILKVRGARIAAALAGGDAGPPAFDVDSIRKDLATMVAEGKTVYDEAAKDGWGKRDGASLPAYWPMRNSRAGEKR